MQIDFSSELRGLDGEPIQFRGAPMTLRGAVVEALLANYDGERLSGADKIKRFSLAERIFPGGQIEVSSEENVLIRELVDKCYGTFVYGAALKLLPN